MRNTVDTLFAEAARDATKLTDPDWRTRINARPPCCAGQEPPSASWRCRPDWRRSRTRWWRRPSPTIVPRSARPGSHLRRRGRPRRRGNRHPGGQRKPDRCGRCHPGGASPIAGAKGAIHAMTTSIHTAVLERPQTLAGVNVAVTHDREQAQDQAEIFQTLGAQVYFYPCVEILPFDQDHDLDQSLRDAAAGKYEWLVFNDADTALVVGERIREAGVKAEELRKLKVATIGCMTERYTKEFIGLGRLCARGLLPGIHGPGHEAEARRSRSPATVGDDTHEPRQMPAPDRRRRHRYQRLSHCHRQRRGPGAGALVGRPDRRRHLHFPHRRPLFREAPGVRGRHQGHAG